MSFTIHPHAATPIYRQIIEQVERQIASGQLKAGAELPSVRAVAQEHAINPMTVSKAPLVLGGPGLVGRLRGVGIAVAQPAQRGSAPDPLAMLTPTLTSAAQVVRQLGVADADALALLQRCLDALDGAPAVSTPPPAVTTPSSQKGHHD